MQQGQRSNCILSHETAAVRAQQGVGGGVFGGDLAAEGVFRVVPSAATN